MYDYINARSFEKFNDLCCKDTISSSFHQIFHELFLINLATLTFCPMSFNIFPQQAVFLCIEKTDDADFLLCNHRERENVFINFTQKHTLSYFYVF